jgi:hypothetical protein
MYYKPNQRNGLGFVENESISDLNKAMDSLDNTQFRNSIKAGSGADSRHSKTSDVINELS